MNNIEYAEFSSRTISIYVYLYRKRATRKGWLEDPHRLCHRTDCTPLIVCKSPQVKLAGPAEMKQWLGLKLKKHLHLPKLVGWSISKRGWSYAKELCKAQKSSGVMKPENTDRCWKWNMFWGMTKQRKCATSLLSFCEGRRCKIFFHIFPASIFALIQDLDLGDSHHWVGALIWLWEFPRTSSFTDCHRVRSSTLTYHEHR